MTEERVNAIPDTYSSLLIPASDSISVIPESDFTSLIPGSDSTLANFETLVNVENIQLKCAHLRGYSTGDISVPYRKVKILSRYLAAATTGSCHDYCKYGRKHDFEKMGSPILVKIAEKQDKFQYMEKSVLLAERRKKLAVSPTVPFPISKSQKPEVPIVTKRKVTSLAKKENFLFKRLSLRHKGTSVSSNCAADPRLKPVQSKPPSSAGEEGSSGKEDGEIQEREEMEVSLLNSDGASSSRIKPEVSKMKEIRISKGHDKEVSLSAIRSVKKAFMCPIVSLSPKHSAKRMSIFSNTEKSKNKRRVSHQKDQRDVRKTEPQQSGSEHVPERIIHVMESNAENKTMRTSRNGDFIGSPSASFSPAEDRSSKRAPNRIQTAQLPPPSAKKASGHTQNGIYVTQPTLPSESKSLRQTRNGSRVVQSSTSPLPSMASSKSSHGGASSECDERETEIRVVDTKPESKSRTKKGGIISAKGRDSSARKLNFKKGKVIEQQPVVNTQRSLKFRQRVVGESHNSKVETVQSNLKNKEVDDGKTVEKIEGDKVPLKHQDMEEKKDMPGLLNNVIEETATELVKTRKSKVKALVGAFETVISNKDSKPQTTVGAC